MLYKTIDIPISYNPIKQRHFCTIFDNAYVIHKDNCNPPSAYLEIYHNDKQVIAGLDWGVQSSGNRNAVYGNLEKEIIYIFSLII